jgi:hypothetical protein
MSSDHVPASMQRRVRERAEQRCEYCGVPQEHQEETFHIDHVTPRSAGGETVLANLALACEIPGRGPGGDLYAGGSDAGGVRSAAAEGDSPGGDSRGGAAGEREAEPP